jgi:hypothetical protein
MERDMSATTLSWLPSTYEEAKTWFGFSGGYTVVTPMDQGEVLVAVGLFGRSAEAVATSEANQDVEEAFLHAVRKLVGRL